MSIYLIVPLLMVVGLLQATLMPHLAIWGIFPDLPILVVASWGLLRGPVQGSLWGFIAGVTVDLLSGAPFGAATLSLIIVGLLAGWAKASVLRSNVALPALVVFLVTIVHNLVYLLVLQISGLSVTWLESLFRITLLSAVLNALLTPPIFWLIRWTDTRFLGQEMEI
jgi:rod shape-determining protein MreD